MDLWHGDTFKPSGFGRGWIPAGRNIGLPGDGAAAETGADWTPPPGWHRNHWTPALKARFLDHLSHSGNVRAACAEVGFSPEAAYRLRRRDPLFAASWAAALVLGREASEQVLADRALNGVTEPIFYRGEQVGERVRFDNRLLLAHLARLDRLADDTRAGRHARRFDELLALVAGAAVPEGMADAPGEEGDYGEQGEPADAFLPMARERFVAETGVAALHDARRAAYEAKQAALLREMAAEGEEEELDAYLAEERAEEERKAAASAAVADAAEAGRCAAASAWDEWHADACALVDGMIAEAPAHVAARAEAKRREATAVLTRTAPAFAEFLAPDPVNTVNLSSGHALAWCLRDPVAGVRQGRAGGGESPPCTGAPLASRALRRRTGRKR
ncbi:MAG TPA: hypothetical protein VGE05_09620 [Novosphingobium sp.]